jgi:hypothetical protein
LEKRWPTPIHRHTIIVPIAELHRGVLKAINYGKVLGGELRVVTVDINPEVTAAMLARWSEIEPDIPIHVLPSPYRSVIEPLVDEVNKFVKNEGDYVTVLLPEFVPARWWHYLLHNQTALALKMTLLYRPGDWRGRFRLISDIPFYL